MCLCWNPDGSLCSGEELQRRMILYRKGLYMPELKAMREKMARERTESKVPLTSEQKAESLAWYRQVFDC